VRDNDLGGAWTDARDRQQKCHPRILLGDSVEAAFGAVDLLFERSQPLEHDVKVSSPEFLNGTFMKRASKRGPLCQ
jgi:hypothetical protein